ncbi:hypothetical protein JXA85_02580 [Candidatus Woesearchaeota archaeon]|nr:hypothetical protein [Candidatus Woesearchaeota archaeon]
MKEKTEADFFVELKDPVELRRAVLEASKKSIRFLQNYESIKKNRTEKSEEIERLKATIKEISLLFTRLKAELPKVKDVLPPEFKKFFHSRPVTVKVVKPPIASVEIRPREKEINKLEQELKDIESELERLS